MVIRGNSQFIGRFLDWSHLFFTDPGDDAAPGCLCVSDSNWCKVGRVLAFRQYYLRHAAPHVPAKIHTGKISDAIEAQSFDSLSCSFNTQISFFILIEQILQCAVLRHDCNNTDMERRIIS